MKLRILDIGQNDAHYDDKERYVGKVYECPEEEGRDCHESTPGWLFIIASDGWCFYECRVEIVWEEDIPQQLADHLTTSLAEFDERCSPKEDTQHLLPSLDDRDDRFSEDTRDE